MTQKKSIRDTVSVNGDLLRADRIAAGFSQEALLAACDKSFHIGTLRRAERSENISRIYLHSIAQALEQNPQKYIAVATPAPNRSGVDITGDWASFFVQNHMGSAPYVVQERTELAQIGDSITGFSESEYRGSTVRDVYSRLELRGDMLVGHSTMEGWGDIVGFANVQVVIGRASEWGDGIVSWFDSDWHSIRCSRFIMIRTTSRFFDNYMAEAKTLMDQEISLYRARFGTN